MPGPRVGGRDQTTAGIWNAKQAFTYDAPKKEDVDGSTSSKTKTNPKQCFTKKIEFGFAQYGGADGSRTRVRKEIS